VSRAVFLDRDGVLNPLEHRNGRPRAPVSLETFQLYPWAAECVGRLRAAGYVCVVVTNQPEVATGELAPEVLEAIHARLRRETGVDGIYACPHRDEHGCECRKPKPGMLLRAAKEHGIDRSASFLVGDRWRDIGAGEAAGCVTVLVAGSDEPGGNPRYRVNDLRDAVDLIIRGVQQGR